MPCPWRSVRRARRRICLLALLIAAGGCAGPGPLNTPGSDALSRARAAGWHEQRIDTGELVLAAWLGPLQASGTPVIFIEGDGHAWNNRRRPSSDPTPRQPIGLELAMSHPGAAAYLARPCQYVAGAARDGCDTTLWTSGRYSETVVAAMDRAISRLKQSLGAERVVLAGFSGGAGVAVLVAARRGDVAGLISIAGNLDHEVWTATHGVSPLSESLNPAAQAAALTHLPQALYSGARDAIVPPAIAAAYRARFAPAAPIHSATVDDADHRCCWARHWPALYRQALERWRQAADSQAADGQTADGHARQQAAPGS